MVGKIYTPLYVVHPETERLLAERGKKQEFDPVVAQSEMRAYRDTFLRVMNEQKIDPKTVKSKIQNVTRMRSRDHRLEFLVWTERQTFLDNLKNEVGFTRNYCGIFKIPIWDTKTTADGQGGTKEVSTIKGWKTLYEVPFNEENVKRIKELADDPFTLQTYTATDQSEDDQWTIKPEDFDKWAEWPFHTLIEYARNPNKFLGNPNIESPNPFDKKIPEMSKNELFSPQVENSKKKERK